jgi:hypothetical protein
MKPLILALAFLICATPVFAQDCTIAAYWDAAGTMSHGFPDPYANPIEFSVYVVIFAEDVVAAAAYSMEEVTGSSGFFLAWRRSGPSGNGLVIDEPEGTSVALTECVIGFGGNAVLVDTYHYLAIAGWPGGLFALAPHTGQDPDFPQYVTCNDILKDCAVGPELYVFVEFDTEARSFGAVKSLFR